MSIELLALLPFLLGPGHETHAGAATPAREEERVFPDGREEVANLIARLRELSGQRGELAAEGQAAIARLAGEFPESGPKDRRDIVAALERLFEPRRKAARGPEQESDVLQLAAAEALGRMGPGSVPVLIEQIGREHLEEDLALQRELLLALGTTRDKRALDPLTKTLQHKHSALVAAAGEALGSFDASEQALRKEAFEEVLKVLTSAKSSSDRYAHEQGTAEEPQPSPEGAVLADRYEKIRAPLMGALARLSKHVEGDPEAWQRWWNKNKKSSWEPRGE